jgi:hypothetical protein
MLAMISPVSVYIFFQLHELIASPIHLIIKINDLFLFVELFSISDRCDILLDETY